MYYHKSTPHGLPLPLIVLGKDVPGCQSIYHRKNKEFEIRRNEGPICRVDGIDLLIDASAAQNSEWIRLGTKAVLVGTSLDTADVDLHKLQEVIQRRTRLLLSVNIAWGERHFDVGIRTPLAADDKTPMIWDAAIQASEEDFSLKRGDQIMMKIKRAIFDVTMSAL